MRRADLIELLTKLNETREAIEDMKYFIRSDLLTDPARQAIASLRWREQNLKIKIEALEYSDQELRA